MMSLRRELVLLLAVLTIASSLDPVRSSVSGRIGKEAVRNQSPRVDDFASVLPSSGCFGASTRIPGAEGDFAVVATDNAGGVYVAYQSLWIENGSDPYVHVYFACSHDYGESWSESFRVDDNGDFSVQCDSPSITVHQLSGDVYVAWKDNRTGVAKVYVDKSVDRGVSFGSDVVVYDWPYDEVFMGLPFTVNIEAGDYGRIYVAWIAYHSGSLTDSDILFSRSVDAGQTFSTPVAVNPEEGAARLLHPWIAVGEASVLYVAYSRRNSTFSGVYVTKSLDEGSSFGASVKVNDDSTARYRGGTQVSVSPDGKVHVTWTDGRAGDGSQYLDVYYAASLDGGVSFEPNVRVNDDCVVSPPEEVFTRGAQGTPSIAADSSSRVHIVWEDFRNYVSDTTYCRDIYYASSDGGVRFSQNLKANSVNVDADSVNCADPNMAIDSEDNFFIVYSDAPSGDNDHPQVYFTFASSSAWKWTKFVDWFHYHNYTEIAAILSALNDTYSNVVDVFSIGESWQGRDIYCVCLTDESDGRQKPQVLFVGDHHAQEQISAELPLYFVVQAATTFGLNETMSSLLRNCEVYVIVSLNVDGLDLFGANDRQRKNARPVDDDYDGLYDEDPPEDGNGNGLVEVLVNRTDPYNPEYLAYEGIDNDADGVNAEDWVGGVDLNRNYPVGWEYAVSDPSSPVYRGSAPFSEPETRAIRDFVLERHFTYALSFHSGLEFIIYPWGCSADPTPDDARFVEMAQELSNITGGTEYASPTVNYGIWDDWMYGEAGVLAMTCEIFRNETWKDFVVEPGPYPNTAWEGGERWLYNPFPDAIETVVQRWLPVFAYMIDRARIPTITILTPEDRVYSASSVPLTFAVDESASWMGYGLDDEMNETVFGNVTLLSLVDGLHHVVVYANNSYGNVGMAAVYFTVDTVGPSISDVVQDPLVDITPDDLVGVNASVIDVTSGVEQVLLNCTFTNGTGTWHEVFGMAQLAGDLWNGTIPALPYGTNVTYVIVAEDAAGNTVTTEQVYGYKYGYPVVPEFLFQVAFLAFVMTTILVVAAVRKREAALSSCPLRMMNTMPKPHLEGPDLRAPSSFVV